MTSHKVFSGRVIFDHQQKTAGQAVNAWLMEALGTGCVTPNLIGNHLDLIQQYGGLYSIISAHIRFSNGEGLDPRYQYMTFFRDPVDRVISWLYFVVNNHSDSQLPELRAAVKRFLENEGQDIPDMLLGYISNVYADHFCRIKGNVSEPDDKKIENALAAIKQYDVVGVYGEMPRFLADVAALVGLPPPQEIPPVNVTTQRPKLDQISSAFRERIVALNQLDLRLFQEVKAWKASTVQTETIEAPQLKAFKWEKYQPLRKPVVPEPVPKTVAPERVRDRVVTTPDLAISAAVLREGSDIRHGQLMTFDVDFFLAREVRDLKMGIHLFDSDRQLAFGINSPPLGQSHQSLPSGSYRASHHLIADLPAGKYTAGFAFAEHLQDDRQRELAWRDVMCEFQVSHQAGKTFEGYSYLPAEISLCPTRLAPAEMVVGHPTGSLLVERPVSSMAPGEQSTMGVTVVNRSEQVWVGDNFRPVRLSYHWLNDSGDPVVFDGIRTPLPADGVAPGQTLSAEMLVEAPPEAGAYILELTLVQERVGWFEKKGFESARLTVEVMVPHE